MTFSLDDVLALTNERAAMTREEKNVLASSLSAHAKSMALIHPSGRNQALVLLLLRAAATLYVPAEDVNLSAHPMATGI